MTDTVEPIEDPEEKARCAASDAYHDHPSNPSGCRVRIEEGLDPDGTRCPCEDDWSKFLEFVAGYVIEFSDGGEPEGVVLHRGTKTTCERLKANLGAISYSGDRPIEGANFFIVQATVYDVFQEGGGTA
jgi:hypothetical protein